MRMVGMLAAAAGLALAGCSPSNGEDEPVTTATPSAPVSVAQKNLAAAEAYLAKNGAREGVTTTPSGLQYEVLAAGPADGQHPAPGQYVCVHYRGALLDGTEFDSSYSRGEAAAFPSDALIPGWVEALGMMRPGDAWRLAIHPDLAYGLRGAGGGLIPPNSALVFDVELIKLLDGEPDPGVDCAK